MSCVDKSDRMDKSTNISHRTSSVQKKVFSCHKLFSNTEATGSKMTHFQFREQLVGDLVRAEEDRAVNGKGIQRGRPSLASSQLSRLETKHRKHWAVMGKKRRCRVCSENHKQPMIEACGVGLCISMCRKLYHAKLTLKWQTVLWGRKVG
jgi:hypothetical protein